MFPNTLLLKPYCRCLEWMWEPFLVCLGLGPQTMHRDIICSCNQPMLYDPRMRPTPQNLQEDNMQACALPINGRPLPPSAYIVVCPSCCPTICGWYLVLEVLYYNMYHPSGDLVIAVCCYCTDSSVNNVLGLQSRVIHCT